MKHNLKATPIVFMTQAEHFEAMNYGVVRKLNSTNKSEYPRISFITNRFNQDGQEEFQTNENNEFSQERYIKFIQASILWSSIRENYKPKEWYEIIENQGAALIMVRNHANGKWKPRIFSRYDERDSYPFIDDQEEHWYYARLIVPADLTLCL